MLYISVSSPNDMCIPLAKVVPIMNGLVHFTCGDAPNPFVQVSSINVYIQGEPQKGRLFSGLYISMYSKPKKSVIRAKRQACFTQLIFSKHLIS